MIKHIEIAKKWLADNDSVTLKEVEANEEAAFGLLRMIMRLIFCLLRLLIKLLMLLVLFIGLVGLMVMLNTTKN